MNDCLWPGGAFIGKLAADGRRSIELRGLREIRVASNDDLLNEPADQAASSCTGCRSTLRHLVLDVDAARGIRGLPLRTAQSAVA